jgi:transposase
MWTTKNRARYDRSKLRDPSDLTDEEWALVAPLIPPGKPGGGKRTVIMREIVNGLMYVLSTGCQWRATDSSLPRRTRQRRLAVVQQPNAIEWRPYCENAKNRLYRGSLKQDCRIDPVMLDVVILRAFGDRDAERVLPRLESGHLKAKFTHED